MTDHIVDCLIEKYRERSDVGISKYGTTLEHNNTDDFLEHALEEAMDFSLYLMKIKKILESKGYTKLEDILNIK